MPKTTIISRTTDLPIPAETAFALAQKLELFRYVSAPIFTIPKIDVPATLTPGVEGEARLWWFGVIPSWKHHLRLVSVGDNEMYTNEHGGPVRTWNHRLTFVPLTATSCCYTDAIEVDGGPMGFGTRLFVRLMFRYRHRRWRGLARVLA